MHLDSIGPVAADSTRRLLVCRVAGAFYAIDASVVVQIQEVDQLAKCPHSGEVRGMARVRGRSVPVVDARKRMGLPSREEELRELNLALDSFEAHHQSSPCSDAHHCGLSRWLGEPIFSPAIQRLMERMEEAHRVLREHGAAAPDKPLTSAGRAWSRLRMLKTRIQKATREARELLVCARTSNVLSALTVDFVEGIHDLPLIERQPSGPHFVNELREMDSKSVFVVDLKWLLTPS
ncbi:MAG: chemotaxis protein CheW [Myxococcota bacterium]